MSTIFALATSPGRSAVAVVRVSGPKTQWMLERLAGSVPQARQARLRTLRDPITTEVLDRALVLWFPAPYSFTGEDQAELHIHGGPATISAMIAALAADGLELARPGEFTRRAFQNGKMDLLQAEAVADLVDAETDAQRRQALAQFGGAAGVVQEKWRSKLILVMALTEASIDFADEAVPETLIDTARRDLEQVKRELLQALIDSRGQQIRDGFHIAIIGRPNAGKSSLINALTARDAAIVTPIPGTTRDVIEAPLVISGHQVILADTAGLRQPTDKIEAEGIRRARAWAAAADLRLYVVDRSQTTFDPQWLSDIRSGDVLVINKADLPLGRGGAAALAWGDSHNFQIVQCQAAGGDMSVLTTAISTIVTERLSGSEPPIATRARHRQLLSAAADHIQRALAPNLGPDLFAENLRLAVRSLERITGKVDTEQVLDQIFATFCIGK